MPAATDVKDTVLQEALLYAEQGWKVIPVHGVFRGQCSCRKGKECQSPGKHPMLMTWHQKASGDERQIREWFEGYGRERNIGVVMGPASGIIDIEVDSEEGEEMLADWFGGEIPEVPCFRSGSGFLHRLFRWNDGLPQKANISVAGCMDIKIGAGKMGSQSVFPPSWHLRGHCSYDWELRAEESDPSGLTEGLLGKIWNESSSPTSPRKAKGYTRAMHGSVEGSRNEDMASLIGKQLRDISDLSDRETVSRQLTLSLGANTRNSPPMDEKEVKDIFRSILNLELDRRATNGAIEIIKEPTTQPKGSPESWKIVRAILRVHVTRVSKFGLEEPSYDIEVEHAGQKSVITVPSTELLTANQNYIRNQIYAKYGITMARLKLRQWDNLLGHLTNIWEEFESHSEGGHPVYEALLRYLSRPNPIGVEHKAAVAKRGQPFAEGTTVFVNVSHVIDWCKSHRVDGCRNSATLIGYLKSMGSERTSINSGRTSRSYWKIENQPQLLGMLETRPLIERVFDAKNVSG